MFGCRVSAPLGEGKDRQSGAHRTGTAGVGGREVPALKPVVGGAVSQVKSI